MGEQECKGQRGFLFVREGWLKGAWDREETEDDFLTQRGTGSGAGT